MKNKDLKNKSAKELETMLAEKQSALRTFRFAIAGSNTRNVREGRAMRRDVARILTLQNSTMSVNGQI